MADRPEELVRDVGPWTLRKLEYLQDYLTAFLNATSTVWRKGGRISYLDVFAGPGRLRSKEDGKTYDGSPLIAARFTPRISNFVFIEEDSASARSLQRHVELKGITAQARVVSGDCNVVIGQALNSIPSGNLPAVAFVDPAKLNLNWSTIAAIALHKRPRRIEQFILFPWNMDANRFFIEDQDMGEVWSSAPTRLDHAMPDPWRWRSVYKDLQAGRLPREHLRRRVLYLYWRGLHDLGYNYVANPKLVRSDRGVPLYHMFFASDHAAADRIMSHVLFRQPRLGESLPLRGIEDPYSFTDDEPWYKSLQPAES